MAEECDTPCSFARWRHATVVSQNQWRSDWVGMVVKVQGAPTPECRAPEFQAKKLRTWVKLLTDLQIWGCELQKNCVWRPGSTRTRCGSYSALPHPLAVIRGREGGKGFGKEEVKAGRDGKGMGSRKREGREGRESGGMARLGIFVHAGAPRVPSYALVTGERKVTDFAVLLGRVARMQTRRILRICTIYVASQSICGILL